MLKNNLFKYIVLLLILFASCAIGASNWQKYDFNKKFSDNNKKQIENVFHDQAYIYMQPLEPTKTDIVTLRLRADRNNLTRAQIQYTVDDGVTWLTSDMKFEKIDETGYFDYWSGEIPPQSKPYYYKFICGNLESGNTTYVNVTGTSKLQADTMKNFYVMPDLKTPDWSKGVYWYYLMPDSFYNGDTISDRSTSQTTKENAWGNGHFYLEDRFGGDLKGIQQKSTEYISGQMGAGAVYINPIWKSNHNAGYGSLDAYQIEGSFGNEQDLIKLSGKLHSDNLKLMLDMVVLYGAEDSLWFNKSGMFPLPGAYQTKTSPFYNMFKFYKWPNNFLTSWQAPYWDFASDISMNILYRDPSSLLQTYIKPPYSADGWRFDVGFEISGTDKEPIEILQDLRTNVKKANSEALLLGENAYDNQLKSYTFDARQNYDLFYKFRDWMNGLATQEVFNENLIKEVNAKPRPIALSTFNFYNSHDFLRVHNTTQDKTYMINAAQILQMTYLGSPCLYYGDETGVPGEGGFGTFNWNESEWDYDIYNLQRSLGQLRKEYTCLQTGAQKTISVDNKNNTITFGRWDDNGKVLTIASQNKKTIQMKVNARQLSIKNNTKLTDYLTGEVYTVDEEGFVNVNILPGGTILVTGNAGNFRSKYEINKIESKSTVKLTDTNVFKVIGSGTMSGKSDSITFASVPAYNNYEIFAQIDDSSKGSGGLMIRDENTKDASFYAATIDASGKLSISARVKTAESSVQVTIINIVKNDFIRITREDGNSFKTYTATAKPDGTNGEWILVAGSEKIVDMRYNARAGFLPVNGEASFKNLESGKLAPQLYDSFDQAIVGSMFIKTGDISKISSSDGYLSIKDADSLTRLTTQTNTIDYSNKAKIKYNPSNEGDFAGVIAEQTSENYVSAGRAKINGKNVLFLGQTINGKFILHQSIEESDTSKDVVVQLQRVGTRYSAVYSYDDIAWDMIGYDLYANYSDINAGIFAIGKTLAQFDYACFGNSIQDKISTNTPISPMNVDFGLGYFMSNKVLGKMLIKTGKWEYTIGGISQTDKTVNGQMDIIDKVFKDFRGEATLKINSGSGYAGIGFKKAKSGSDTSDGYLLKITTTKKLQLMKGETILGEIDVSDEDYQNPRVVIECKGANINIYLGIHSNLVISVNDETYGSGYYTYYTNGVEASVNNYNTYDLHANWAEYYGVLSEIPNGIKLSSNSNYPLANAGIQSLGFTDFIATCKLQLSPTSKTVLGQAGMVFGGTPGQMPIKPLDKALKDGGLLFSLDTTGKIIISENGNIIKSVTLEGKPASIFLMVVAKKGTYQVYVDNKSEPVLEYSDPGKNGGAFSFFTSNSTTSFTNISIKSLQGDEDYKALDVFKNRVNQRNSSILATDTYSNDFSDSQSSLKYLETYDGKWTVSNGTLNCENQTSYNAGIALTYGKYKDFEMTLKCKITSPAKYTWLAIEFRKNAKQDNHEMSGYALLIGDTGGSAILCGGSRKTVGNEGTIPLYIPGSWVNVKVICRGTTITVYANGQQIITATDATFKEGFLSLNSGSASGSFDDVVVKPLN